MTVPPETIEDPEVGSRVDHQGPPDPGANPRTSLSARDAVSGMCPYLLSAGGAWRSTTPSRDHRCSAVAPAVPQATDKQRRHCLAADHVACSLFRIAREARANNLIGRADPATIDASDRARRPIARTAPVLLEPTRLVDQTLRLRFDRGPGQLALIGLMIVAFAIVGLARLSGAAAPSVPSAQPSIVAVAPSRAPTPRPSPSVAASVAPSVSPEPSFRATYTVKKGDTLAAVAARYKTTVATIVAANALKTKTLKIGQVLKIP